MRRMLVVLFLLALSLGLVSAATVTGQVVDTDGKPIKGASLHLDLGYEDRKPLDLLSDGAGNFSVTLELGLRPPNTDLASIVAYAPGYALTSATLKENGTVITLSAGITLSGTVVDPDGKPLAGIPVRLNKWQDRDNNAYATVPEGWHALFTVTSRADGAWTLPGIPRQGLSSLVLDDDRYVHAGQDVQLYAGEQAAPVQFTARPGATLTGRVLTPTGAPAADAGVRIFLPQNNSPATGGTGKTAADGSYRFTGLATGQYTIMAYSEKQEWMIERLPDIALTAGKESAAPDIRTHLGAALEGTVVDAETGTPIPGFTFIRCYKGHANDIASRQYALHTQSNGHFFGRTEPGPISLLVEYPPYGYLRQQDAEATLVELRDEQTATVTLKLHKGLTVTGTVTDNEGKPAAGVNFLVYLTGDNNGGGRENDTRVGFTTDQQGHFEAAGLSAGKGTLTLIPADRQPNAWEQPAPLAITVPAKAPLTVSLTRIALHTVRGRVLDARQHPLAGVTANFSVYYTKWRDPQKLTALTGTDGRYALEKIPAGVKVDLISLEKAGYRQHNTSTLANDGNDTIADAVMAACTATVRGKVRGIDGKPVQGATVVSAEGGLSARAVTDAAGAFVLGKQPEGELHLVAATPYGGGVAICTAPTNGDTGAQPLPPAPSPRGKGEQAGLEHETGMNSPQNVLPLPSRGGGGGERLSAALDVSITCVPATVAHPVDIPLAVKVLDADKGRRRFNRSETLHEIADVDLEQAIRLSLAGDEPISEGLRAYLLGKQAEKDPVKVSALLVQLNMLHNDDCKLYAAAEIGIAVAQTDPALAEQLYQIAKPLYDRSAHGNEAYKNIEGLGRFDDISLRTIALAALLHKTADLDAMLRQMSVLAQQAGSNCQLITRPLFEAAGRVSPEFVFTVYHKINNEIKSESLYQAELSMAQHDPAATLRLVDMVVALHARISSSAIPAPIIKALAAKDPAAALTLVNAHPYFKTFGLFYAAASQPKAAGKALMLDYLSQQSAPTIGNVAQANAVDPELGKALYAKYKANLEAQSYHFGYRSSEDGSTSVNRVQYAYVISSIDPVEARLILETEFATALSKAPHDGRRNDLQYFPQAMCSLDLKRAQQMLAAIGATNPNYQWAMQYILMPRVDRVCEPFS